MLWCCHQIMETLCIQPMSFTYRITLVHQSKSRPNWNNKIIDDIKALNIYDETTVDTKWNEYTHNNGKIVGAVVFANHLSNWYQHDEAYYQSIDMAYGPYCHGVSDYVEFDQPIVHKGSAQLSYPSDEVWGVIREYDEFKKLKANCKRKYRDDIDVDCKPCVFSVIAPMADLIVNGHKSIENRNRPLFCLKGYTPLTKESDSDQPTTSTHPQTEEMKTAPAPSNFESPKDITQISYTISTFPSPLVVANCVKVLAHCFEYDEVEHKVQIVLLINYKEKDESPTESRSSERYIYLDSVHRSSRVAGEFGKYLRGRGVRKWQKLEESFMDGLVMIRGGKRCLLLNIWFYFAAIGPVAMKSTLTAMINTSEKKLSVHELVARLYRAKGNLVWPHTDEDVASISYVFQKPTGGVVSRDLVTAPNAASEFIVVPIEEALFEKRKGQGKRKHQLNNESSKSLDLTLILIPKAQDEIQRRRALELEHHKQREKENQKQHHNDTISDLRSLMEPGDSGPLIAFDPSHSYTLQELLTAKESRDKTLYWRIMKMQYPDRYEQSKRNTIDMVTAFAAGIDGVLVETTGNGDCGMEACLIVSAGNKPLGQELLQQRLKLVEWMKQQTDKFEHYDLMKEYYPDAQNTMDLLHKWAQPFVPLTAIHIQELARMLNKNLLLITVGQHYPYTYHHFQYNDNAECLVITHYHWGHFDRIVGVNGQLSVKSIEFFDAQYADLENTDANDEKNEPNSDEIPPLKPPAYTQNKKRKKHITNVAFGMDSDDENEEMCMWNTNNNERNVMRQPPALKRRKVTYTDGTSGHQSMVTVMKKLDELNHGFHEGMSMMCDRMCNTLMQGFEQFGRSQRRARSRSLSDTETSPPKSRKSHKRRSKLRKKRSKSSSPTVVVPPRQWSVQALADHAYQVAKGQSAQSTAYYKLCLGRSGGINKYYKSVCKMLVFKRVKISLDAYQTAMKLGDLCESNGCGLTTLSQLGAKNAGFGSTANWNLSCDEAKGLLTSALFEHLSATIGKAQNENET
eukprot:579761_1